MKIDMDPVENNESDMPPSSTQNESPAKTFLMLIAVVVSTPFIFLYSILRGRIRNPIIVIGFLLLVLYGFYLLSETEVPTKKDIKTKIIQQTLEELTPEEKQQLREEISTIRKEIDIDKIPKPLYPVIDVPIDMLSINYLMFMIQSGYIISSGEGAEFILDSYLHSNHKLLREKSWEALKNINTEAAKRIMQNYRLEVEKQNKVLKKKYEYKATPDNGILKDITTDLQNTIQNIKDKAR